MKGLLAAAGSHAVVAEGRQLGFEHHSDRLFVIDDENVFMVLRLVDFAFHCLYTSLVLPGNATAYFIFA